MKKNIKIIQIIIVSVIIVLLIIVGITMVQLTKNGVNNGWGFMLTQGYTGPYLRIDSGKFV